MRVRATGVGMIVLVSILSSGATLNVQDAYASTPARERPSHHATNHHPTLHHAAFNHRAVRPAYYAMLAAEHPVPNGRLIAGRWRHVVRGGISCVPFARSDSGIALSGNAWQWWDHAAGVYARGHVPEVGSVMAFRANPRMVLGHVAVVSQVVNRREIEIDQANWWGPGQRGGVARNVPVVDVSEANDWSAVRVGLGRSGDFGAVYPTYGFIYDRPDNGVMLAAAHAPAPEPALNPVPRDLRPVAERPWATFEQVAEAPTLSVASSAPANAEQGPSARANAEQAPTLPETGGAVGAIDRK